MRPFALLPLTLLVAMAASAATREVRKTIPAGTTLVEVENLAGAVRLEEASGGAGELLAVLHAEGSDDGETKELLASLDIELEEGAGRFAARARYPLDRTDTIHYPRDGERDEEGFVASILRSFSRSTVRYRGRRVTVITASRHRSPVLFVDVTLRVPRGAELKVTNSVGAISGEAPGPVTARADSADIRLSRAGGRAELSTGSGDVLLRHAEGEARVHTGSGDVRVVDAAAGLSLDTGSGDVVVKGARGEAQLSTGSGDVEAFDLSPARLKVHTGSGNVSIAGDLSGAREVSISSASGDVSVALAKPFPMRLEASTASGGLRVNVPGMRTLRKDDESFTGEVDGGGASVKVSTASGNVRVASR